MREVQAQISEHMTTETNHSNPVLLGLTPEQLRDIVAEEGLPAFAAKQLAQWIYQKGVGDFLGMSNISIAARKKLAEHYDVGFMPPVAEQHSVDGTAKYLFPTQSGQFVETVFIPDDDCLCQLPGGLQDGLSVLHDGAPGLSGATYCG